MSRHVEICARYWAARRVWVEDAFQQMSQRYERNVEAGDVIADRYRVEAPIGHGAMGSVWRAVHVRLDAPVAIKFLNRAIAGDPVMLDRFMREARAAAAVRSSHVVQIFDYGVDRGDPYIAMELLVGETLDARLATRGPLAPPELDKLFSEVARAVGVAHELGVVHRDIKPANIFIAREGDHDVTKVLDFGIAKLIDHKLEAPAARATDTGILLGTPHYMSPEQARGHRQVDQRADLWALAVLAFECLTGRQPFESESLGDLVVQICTGAPLLPSAVAELPPAFDRWFLRGVSKEPAERFGSAAEMASELHALLQAEGLGAASRPRSEPSPRRLELVGTEVIPTAQQTTNREQSPPMASAPLVESPASLSATAVTAEVSPRPRPARQKLAVAALALSAPVLALLLSQPQRAPTPRPATTPATASATTPEVEGNLGPVPAPPSAAAAETPAQPPGAGVVGAVGAAGSAGEKLDLATPKVATSSIPAPQAAPTTAAARASRLQTASPRAGDPTPTAGPASQPTSAGRVPRRSAAPHRERDAPLSATPSSARPTEVVPPPASVPPASADPYADRL